MINIRLNKRGAVEEYSNKEYIKEKNRCLKTYIYIYKTDV